jgi:hypothetical protein
MVREQVVPKRGALYYPYIHIHDENWLKATLLSFRQVRRIVPYRFTVRDEVTIQPYASLEGPDGPLLDDANIQAQPVHDAQRALKSKIEDNLAEIDKRYKQDRTPTKYQTGPASFQINRYKLLESFEEPGLADLLLKHNLAWHSADQADEEPKDWLTMHPRLGAAVMSTLALAIEKNEGLHIVTPSVRAHNTLLANREDQVFQALLEIPSIVPEDDLGKTADELMQIVITTGFDLTQLQPQDIKAIIDNGADLQQFRNAVSTFAQEIAPGMGREYREKALKQKADEVLAKWNDHQSLLSPSIRQSFRDLSIEKVAEKVGEKIIEGLSGGVTGAAVTHSLLGFLPGFAISIVLVSGVKAYLKHKNHPMRYLNRVEKATVNSFGSLYVPQWSSLAAVD